MTLPDLVRYYRACYEAENQRSGLLSAFATRVEKRLFMRGQEDLFNDHLDHTPLDLGRGRMLHERAFLARKETDLLYASLFVVGKVYAPDGSGATTLCAPLVTQPATIFERDTHRFLRLEARRQWNEGLLELLTPPDTAPSLLDATTETFGDAPLDAGTVLQLGAFLQERLPGLDTAALHRYPDLLTERTVRRHFNQAAQSTDTDLRVLPASAALLIRKSVETRGVLNELAALAEAKTFAPPLRALFASDFQPLRHAHPQPGHVPAVLSDAQQRILASAATAPLTLVVGPPGTGKSFTIAALAMEHLSRGQSVLIASKKNHAVDVVGYKVEQQLGIEGCVVRGGRKQYLKALKQYLQQLLSGIYTDHLPRRSEVGWQRRVTGRFVRRLQRLERTLHERIQQAGRYGTWLAEDTTGFWRTMQQNFGRWQTRRQEPIWRLAAELHETLDGYVHHAGLLVQQQHRHHLRNVLRYDRRVLNTFLQAIRARTGGKQETLFQDLSFEKVFQALPVWLVNLADVAKVLPFEPALFDLVILDEASQCDVASCLPVLQRARRAVIVGDPNQLRHLSFLARARQAALQAEHGMPPAQADRFDYREKSILDVTSESLASQEQVHFLNEHFRSAPAIIAFSNRRYYGDALHLMTQKPNPDAPPPLVLHPGPDTRDEDGVNPGEAERLLADVEAHLATEQALPSAMRHRIGILSPFRAQVDHLREAAAARLGLEALARHDVLIGTAHTFQGEERDVMYLSLALDDAYHSAALRFLEQDDVFNVAITRARAQQHLYFSLTPEQLPGGSLLRAYLTHAATQPEPPSAPVPTDPFAQEVRTLLEERGYQVWMGYPVAGLQLDLVVLRNGRSCGIDLIGYPGTFEAAFPLERYKLLHRAGLPLVPLTYARWLLDREACLSAIEAATDG